MTLTEDLAAFMGMTYQPQVLVISDKVYQQALDQQRDKQVRILETEKARLSERLRIVDEQMKELMPVSGS